MPSSAFGRKKAPVPIFVMPVQQKKQLLLFKNAAA